MQQLTLTGSYQPCEVLAVRLRTRRRCLNIIVLYRPPQSPGFEDQLEELFDEVSALSDEFIICGDFNCASSSMPETIGNHLATMLDTYNLQQHVNSPTRGKALLDLVITPSSSSNPLICNMKVLDFGVSDHYVISAQVNVDQPRPSRITYVRRNYRGIDITAFRQRLLASNVSVDPCTTTNDYAHQLNDCISAILDDLAPARSVTKRRGKPTADWLSEAALQSRRERRKLESRYRQNKTEANRIAYRLSCRRTNKLINQSRRDHIHRQLAEAAGDSRKRWRIANKLLHKSDQNHQNHIAGTAREPTCDRFSDFFTNKIRRITETIANRGLCHRLFPISLLILLCTLTILTLYQNLL